MPRLRNHNREERYLPQMPQLRGESRMQLEKDNTMRITMEWLGEHDACDRGLHWFEDSFPDGGERDKVLKRLEETNELNYYIWLLRRTLKENQLPEGWVLPGGLEYLNLGGGTLPEGTQLPARLKWINLGGGTLPEGTCIPRECIVYN